MELSINTLHLDVPGVGFGGVPPVDDRDPVSRGGVRPVRDGEPLGSHSDAVCQELSHCQPLHGR